MKREILLKALISTAILFAFSGSYRAVSDTVKDIQENITQRVMRLANEVADGQNTEDPEEIFQRSIDDYMLEFDEYIDITAMNVQDREDVVLPGFDIEYVVPGYEDIMHDYQENLESSLTVAQSQAYTGLRQSVKAFDNYVTNNKNKYDYDSLLSIDFDYSIKPFTAATTLASILLSAGLSQNIITAFTGAVGSLSLALSTSWIPFVGWVLAVALAVGALIAITVIIVQFWDEISSILGQIEDWFLSQFSKFSSLIVSYFGDAEKKGYESTVAHRQTIGGRVREFIDTEVTPAVLSAIVDDCFKNDKVYLMGHIANVANGQHWWICYDTTDVQTVIDEKVYNAGVCTYTWYNNTAKKMMAEGSHLNGDYTRLIYERPDEGTATVHGQNDLIGWNHYHMGYFASVNGVETLMKYDRKYYPNYARAHSMFGRLAYRDLSDSEYTYYPDGFLG